ncbi:MAG TPA: hypothetical protein VMB03_00215 [Bryobacteraceae bacterium]|nr:hypothetical protein [Bryobacteraceae bacterium]
MTWAHPTRTAGQFDPYPTEWSLSSSPTREDEKRPPQSETNIPAAEEREPAA